ncbi:hypothetical protein HDV00_006781 [Rhizophlyctis rosea]|nr:hypothetical protein HDV00_006781 [Rhizophlyctis rosea]
MQATPRKKGRLVRRASPWSRLRSLPADLYLSAAEWMSSIDWQDLFSKSSFTLGLGLNALYLFVKFIRKGIWTGQNEFIDVEEIDAKGAFSSMDSVVPHNQIQGIEWLLIAISVINTIYMFNRSKDFTLFRQPTRPRDDDDRSWIVKSPNAKIVPMDLHGTAADVDDEKDSEDEESTPTTFCLFSPQQIAILYLADIGNWQYYMPLAFFVSLMTYMLVTAFQDLLHDREILQEQLVKEFSEGFVYTTSPFRDHHHKGTQTGPAGSTPLRTPRHSPYTPSSTHSPYPRVGDEYGEDEEDDD